MLYQQFRRRSLHLTQAQLAERSGITRWMITQIEAGRINPRPDELAKLASALGVSPPDRLIVHVADPFEHDLPEVR